jgi:hypothetical protein
MTGVNEEGNEFRQLALFQEIISLGRTRGECDKGWRKLPVAHEVNQEFRYTFLKHYAVVFE